MDNNKLIKLFKQEVKIFGYNNFIPNRKDTPIIYKLSKNTSNIKNLVESIIQWISLDIDLGIDLVRSTFDLKEIPQFKITYKNKSYHQKDYGIRGGTKWIKNFIQQSNIPSSIFLRLNTKDTITFSKKRNDFPDTTSPTKLDIQGEIIYFNHKHWGCDKLGKAIDNPNRKTEGDGILCDKIKLLSEYLGEEISIDFEGNLEVRSLGGNPKYKDEKITYESNNSNL